MMSGSFCDLAEQTGRLFISEYFIQERKLPDAEFDHSAAGFRQNLQKPLPEPGYILSSGDGITVGESCQAFIIIAQQAVAIQHKEKQQDQNQGKHDLRHQGGGSEICSQPLSGIYTEQIPVVQSHRFQKKRIGFAFIIEGREDTFPILQRFPDSLTGFPGQIGTIKEGRDICLYNRFR